MQIKWTSKSASDLSRLFEFLAYVNRNTAAKTVQTLVDAPNRLIQQPFIGERLDSFTDRDVRRLIISSYEMRYEVTDDVLFILRIWHTREKR
ncbi:type II toxin-antitoxin system RelE/ParE family toxin [Parashewanella spongiae]|uniref:Type II toxin-antitoxin system RelE/ParE family toxin n=1 Tax=Parashewanella spongiae TaxID=342950 RepID=A0A3A6U3F9_9GAMM|nr:type II toxin-antitoxin system RelE/ParE family toxin [Parashewanella spongiae]MCL1079286.1 type II toxin-antitoxin system RelE/ParE family toxin [Parashewanella spongiae]RJY10421.1 type II toxin-antitoxin system RelE/ParE family toxin [Parashewanella spongiae]